MKRKLLAAAAIAMLSLTAWSQGYGPGGGMGPGMMGGYGGGYGSGYGMGPGMMWGYDSGLASLKLSEEQRKKISQIEEDTAQAQWKLMGTMHQQGFHMYNRFGPEAFDEAAARKSFQVMADAQKAMFELSLDERKRIDAVLTREQREQLRRGASGR